MKAWATAYVIATAVFCVLDLIWLGAVAEGFYDRQLGELRAPEPRIGAAVAFYALFLAGVVFFVVQPALAAGSWRRALLAGGLFGLVTYATWDLTNLAVIRGFPAALVPVGLAWGTVLTATVSVTAYAGCRRWAGDAPETGR